MKRISFVLLVGLSFTACKKDKPPQRPAENVTLGQGGGVFVLNEGNYMFGNAKVSYHSFAQGTTVVDLYNQTNALALGDVLQSMNVYENKAYLVVNNSAKIEVCDPVTLKREATITGFTSPRYMLPVSHSKAYVTDLYADKIWVVNLVTHTVSGNIPLTGWCEQMCEVYGNVFVANYEAGKIYVINSATDAIADSVTLTYGAESICQDNNGKLWVLCQGKASASVAPVLYKIDPVTYAVEQNFILSGGPSRLCTNGTADTLYYLNAGVCRFTSAATGISATPFISQGTANFYGLGIDPHTSDIFVTDAGDYVSSGKVLEYKASGISYGEFTVGVIPSGFWFE